MKQPESLIRTVTTKASVVMFALSPEGTLTFFEGKGLDRFGLDAKQNALGRSYLELWARSPDISGPLTKAMQGQELAWTTEMRGVTYDVVATPVSDGGVVGVARDVTAHRAAESALKDSQAKFAAAFRQSLDSVLLTAIPSGEILEINRGFTLITGYERDEAVGKTTADLSIWQDAAEREEMFATLEEHGKISGMSVKIRHRSGESRCCLLWGELLETQGAPTLLTVVRDVTDQFEAEEERAGFVAELEAKNRELEQFSLAVAHDLKAPLISIQALAEVVTEDMADGELRAATTNLKRIDESVNRMLGLVSSLLELSRGGRAIDKLGTVRLSSLAREAYEHSIGLSRRPIECEIDPSLGTVVGDRARLFQVFQNLISNAVKFVADQPKPKISVGVRRETAQAVYFVRDNGQGIEEEERERIFDLFYGRRRAGLSEGTGIGLALAKRIVEVHGGRIWVESEGPGRGACFCFTLAG